MHLSKEVISWIAVAVWAAAIFYVSAQTGDDLSDGSGFLAGIIDVLKAWQEQLFGPDADVMNSAAHFCEYTLLGALLVNALRYRLGWKQAVACGVVVASCYGVTDEIHQLFVPGRFCDPVDWAVDTAGATLGAFLAMFVLRRANATRAESAPVR